MKKILALAVAFFCGSSFALTQPKLIVQLIVDQFRGDLLAHYQKKFGENGFNYLIKNGIWYGNAYHPHANTTTCVGHTTISTGSYPRYHGMIDNDWFDVQKNKVVNCVADEKVKTLARAGTKRLFPGRSPSHILSSTFSDELMLSQRGRAFAISYKDRAAITMAGHAGKAYWFDRLNGGFITSSYYYDEYPNWVRAWNDKRLYEKYHGKRWLLSRPSQDYFYPDNKLYNEAYEAYGAHFPHQFSNKKSSKYYKTLMFSPHADSLTAQFAKELLHQEHLGLDKSKTDYLSISFSSNDAIGHNFGPNSLEAEENLLQLDKTLASLFAFIDKQVGLDNTLIIFSADHGVSDSPEYLKKHGINAGRVNIERYIRDTLQADLKQRFNVTKPLIKHYNNPNLYLDHEVILENKLSLDDVSHYCAQQLSQLKGIDKAFAFKDIEYNKVDESFLSKKVATMDVAKRSGDIYVVAKPYWSIVKDKNDDKVSHGSPWTYDAFVPIIFANKQFSPEYITRQVQTVDIAPTLSTLLAIKKPSSSVGFVLEELTAKYN